MLKKGFFGFKEIDGFYVWVVPFVVKRRGGTFYFLHWFKLVLEKVLFLTKVPSNFNVCLNKCSSRDTDLGK